ncbi:Short-chain dehydrogenase [Planctomycetales bacterium 10988]|nr:Short-chain dehydrogenase [Planctomycetales bacterium 10988]
MGAEQSRVSLPKRVLITGVHTGVGHALADYYLQQGSQVWGISRSRPEDLSKHPAFDFLSLDLTDHDRVGPEIKHWLHEVDHFDFVLLNAGILGSFGDLREADLDEMKQVMELNLWANKSVVDALDAAVDRIQQMVFMSSGASVNGNRGWRGYALSKAALNMMAMLYAAELTGTHCSAFAPGIVETTMQDQLQSFPQDERFPSLEALRSKRNTSAMPTPGEAAPKLAAAMAMIPDAAPSGEFLDIRHPPLSTVLDEATV